VVKSGRGARSTTAAAAATATTATEAVAEQQRRANGTVPSTNNGRKRKALKTKANVKIERKKANLWNQYTYLRPTMQ